MKTLKIAYWVFIAIGLLTVVYNALAIQPWLPDFDQMDFRYLAEHPEVEAAYSDARHTSDYLGLAGTALAAIGTVLALVTFIKTKVKYHLVFLGLGAIVAITACMVAFAHVM